MIAQLVITDGRAKCLHRAVASAGVKVHGRITRRVIVDDSADPDHNAMVADHFRWWDVITHDKRRGFAGAIQSAWAHLAGCPERFVFHLEDDFTFSRHVDLDSMVAVLDAHPHLVQLALRRQPVNNAERAAGGVIEMWPDEYTAHQDEHGHHWLEHRLFFTTNPSLYRRSLTAAGWPDAPDSERKMTDRLLANDTLRFAFWGRRSDGPWVEHIGDQRVAAVGY